MSHSIEAITTATVSLALDAASRRHQIIAANIANAGTEGYAPMKLSFDAHLAEARNALRDRGSVDAASLAAARIEPEPVLDARGRPAKVQLDTEMADLAQNAVQYQALTRALSRHMSILAIAVADGRK